MGLSDRDYMHRRESSVLRPERSPQDRSPGATLWMVLTWLAVFYMLYKAFLWWNWQRKPVPKPMPQAVVTAPWDEKSSDTPPELVPKTFLRQEQFPVELHPSTADTHTVKKCVANGRVTFTDGTCPNGSMTSSVTVNTAEVGTVAPRAPEAPGAQFTPQITTSPAAAIQPKVVASSNPAECPYLEMEIKQIDAMARQPLSGQAQDGLSEQRKKIRSRQFALRC